MPTLHIGSAVSEKTGTVNKGFSFIVMGDYGGWGIIVSHYLIYL